MYTENLIVYDDRECKVIEHVGEIVPYVCVSVFAGTLCIEAV
jgi:hypothetical protein